MLKHFLKWYLGIYLFYKDVTRCQKTKSEFNLKPNNEIQKENFIFLQNILAHSKLAKLTYYAWNRVRWDLLLD